ncbi:hypothetical protein ACFL5T_01850 [Gemmatimonadota bacterium]
MLRRAFLAAVTFVVAAVAPLAAQDHDAACAAVVDTEVGYWAEFELSGAPADDVSSLRFAIVERAGETDKTWYEFSAVTNQGPVIVQLDVPGWPFETDDVTGVIVKMAGQPAMRLPNEMLSMMRQQMGDNPMADFAERCETSSVIGEETMEVPAGTFSTVHLLSDDDGSEVWISTDVPFGIVKGNVPDGGVLELTGFGEDATSSIPEEPQMMPGMGGMNQ